MSADSLRQAILLIKSGKKSEAQCLLKSVIQAEPRNEGAWLWYVDTLSTEAERAETLKWCLVFNPDSSAAKRGLAVFKVIKPALSANSVNNKSCVQETDAQKKAATDFYSVSCYQYGKNHTNAVYGDDEGLADLFDHARLHNEDFFCDECGRALTQCSACEGYFCEDCCNARCAVCGELIYVDPEEDGFEREGFHIVCFVPDPNRIYDEDEEEEYIEVEESEA
jgi:hypothetical protein